MDDERDDLKKQVDNLEKRVGSVERALLGGLDQHTNEYVPGIMQTSADTAKRTAKIERWLQVAVVAMVVVVVTLAFPRLSEAVKVVAAAAG